MKVFKNSVTIGIKYSRMDQVKLSSTNFTRSILKYFVPIQRRSQVHIDLQDGEPFSIVLKLSACGGPGYVSAVTQN